VLLLLAAWPAAADDGAAADGPAWLRGPVTRGPLAGTLTLDDRHLWWGVDGTLPLGSIRLPRPRTERQRQHVLGLGLAVTGQATSDARTLRYTALVDLSDPTTGGWLGVSAGGDARESKLSIGTGVWRSLAPVEVEAGLVSSVVEMVQHQALHWGYAPDSLHWRDTTTFRNVDFSALAATAQSAVRWRVGRVELAAVSGVTVNQRTAPRRWAQVTLHVQATKRVLMLAAFGQRPGASLAFDASARTRSMIGIQLAPWASRDGTMARSVAPRVRTWATRSLGDGRTALRMRCPDAARVELAGDFTDWAPVTLDAAGGGVWETRLMIAPGLHDVQIRVDGGAWQVPPGLPTAQDEFAGAAGLLLID
jgi:hypothetical protein